MKSTIIKYLFFFYFLSLHFFCQAQEKEKTREFIVIVKLEIEQKTMTKEELKNATFAAYPYYSELAAKIELKGFSLKYPDQKEIVIKGNKLSDVALQGLEKLKIGDEIVVYNVISKVDFRAVVRGPLIITLR